MRVLIPCREGEWDIIFEFWDPSHISGMAEARDLKILSASRGMGALTKTMQK